MDIEQSHPTLTSFRDYLLKFHNQGKSKLSHEPLSLLACEASELSKDERLLSAGSFGCCSSTNENKNDPVHALRNCALCLSFFVDVLSRIDLRENSRLSFRNRHRSERSSEECHRKRKKGRDSTLVEILLYLLSL
jgi:hypothetical protein